MALHRHILPLYVASVWLSGCQGPQPGEQGPVEIRVGEERVSIGVADLPSDYVLGAAEDVVVLPDGSLVVADWVNDVLRLFSRDGRFLHRSGGEGEGPGEFLRLTGLAVLPGSRVLALDAGLLRLSVFAVQADTIALLNDIRLPFQAHDVCVFNGRIFLLGLHEERAVHEIDSLGRVLRSFGDTPNPGPDVAGPLLGVLRNYNAHGELECVPESDLIVVMPHILPTLRAFHPDGEVAWESTLADYRATRFILTERGSLRLSPDEESGSAHGSWGLFTAGDGRLGVSLEERSWDSRSYELRVLRLGDGQEVGRLTATSGFIALGDGLGWYYEEEPFPRIGARDLSIND